VRAILARPALRVVLDLAALAGSSLVVREALLVAWALRLDARVRLSAVIERTTRGRGDEIAGGGCADPNADRHGVGAARAARGVWITTARHHFAASEDPCHDHESARVFHRRILSIIERTP
jgi:hypothetical protein